MLATSMRILILNRCYPPEVGATGRILRDLARVWARRHEIIVLTGRPSDGPERHPYYLFRRHLDEGIAVERLGSTAFPRRRLLGRLADYLSYMVLAFLRAVTIRPRPDVLIAMTDPPLAALSGAIAAKVRGIPWIYNIRDLHPDMAIAAGIVRDGWFARLWDRLHRWSLRQASVIVVLGEDMRNRVIAKGIPAQRVIVVRDGASQLEAPPDANHPAVQQIRSGCQFVVMHAGNMGFAGAWEALLRAIAKVQQEDGIRFVFVGDGAVRPLIERSINGMPNVRLLPYFPEAALPHVLWAADLHLVTLRHGLEGLVVPSKTYPLLMIGRPILAVVPKTSDIARIVERYQCGILADPDDPEQIRQAILWARDHPSALREMGERARAAGRQFDREALAEEFEGILTDRVKHRDPPR